MDTNLPERTLWAAVLERAVEDAKGNVSGVSLSERDRIILEAFSWFRSNRKTLGGFLWVCDILELEYRSIRKVIAKLEQDYVPS